MNKNLIYLIGLFIVSRILFGFIFKIEFNDFLLDEGWQFLDVAWLKDDLGGSLYYLHSQPPFGNLICGLLLKVFDDIAEPFHFLCICFNLIAIIAFYLSCTDLGIKKSYAFWAAVFLIFHPQFILYENYFFYSVPVMSLITVTVFFIVRYFVSYKLRYLLLFFLALLVLSLTRSMFHIVFILAVTALCFLFSKHKRHSLLIGMLTFLICSSWYLKNKLEFGFFGASSWMGMNISRIMLERDDHVSYISEGPFRPLSNYVAKGYKLEYQLDDVAPLREESKKGSIVNFNNENYIYLAEDFKKAALDQLKSDPSFYLKNVVKGNFFYYKPTIHYSHLESNYRRLHIYASLYILDIPSLLELSGVNLSKNTFIVLSTIPPISFHLLIYFLLFKYFRKVNWKELSSENMQVIFISVFVLFVMGIGNLLELYENNRFRFTTTVIFYQVSLLLLVPFIEKLRARGTLSQNSAS